MSKSLDKAPSNCLIIGSGIGGLSLGALLAKSGVQVTILEAHPNEIGGLAQTISGNNYKFTFGPRYLWNFGEGEIGSRFLEHLELADLVDMTELDRHGFDQIFVKGKNHPISVPNDWMEYQARLIKEFPNDATGLEKFFDICELSYEFLNFADQNGLYFYSWPRSFVKLIAKYWMRPLDILKFTYRMSKTFQAVCDDCKLSPLLQSVLYAHGMIFAETQQRLSFYAYVGATLHYVRASHFPAIGLHGLTEILAKIIRTNGGEILLDSKVSKIITDGQKCIQSVQTEKGEEFSAEIIVSNIDPMSFQHLLRDDPGGYRPKKLPRYEYSKSLTSTFIGIKDRSVLEPRFGKWNIWYCGTPDSSPDLYDKHPESPPERMYLNSPSLINRKMKDAPDSGATLTAFVPASFSAYADAAKVSKQTHDELLTRQENQVLDIIEEQFVPEIRDQLGFIKTISPYDVSVQFNAPYGNVYGKAFLLREVLIKLPWNDKLKNLYHVGQYTTFAGVANCILSACHIFRHLTDTDI